MCHGWRRLTTVRVKLTVVLAALLFVRVPVAGLTEVLTDRDIAQALNIANGSEASRGLFHAPYRVAVDDPLVEHLEIITEFRRFVLAAEDQVKNGNWMMARGGYDTKGRTLKDLLRAHTGRVSIRAQLRFHPHNNYATLPPFDILLGNPTLLALDAIRTPHITLAGEPGTRDTLYAATIETFYNAPTVADRVLPVRLMFEEKEIALLSVDFSRVE